MGVPGAWSQPEQDGARDKTEEDGGGDKAGALILINMGVPGAWSQPIKKTQEGTRMERLSSTNMGVPGAWSQPEEDGGGDKDGALILNQYGGPRCMVST